MTRVRGLPATQALIRRRIEEFKRDAKNIRKRVDTSSWPGKITVEVDSTWGNSVKRQLEAAANDALESIALELDTLLTQSIQSSSWAWDNGTRDIVDTGALLDSQRVAVSGDSIVISYGVPYATFVHEGGYIQPYGNKNIEAVYIPARPWVDSVIYGTGPVPSIDMEGLVDRAFAKYF